MQEKINKACERKCYDFDSFKMVHTNNKQQRSLQIPKKNKKMIRVLLRMTVSWPHTFREEETESFHERNAGKRSVFKRDDTTDWRILQDDPQTYKCIYLHTMNPEVCQNDSSIWNNKHTKCTEYMELLKHKIL